MHACKRTYGDQCAWRTQSSNALRGNCVWVIPGRHGVALEKVKDRSHLRFLRRSSFPNQGSLFCRNTWWFKYDPDDLCVNKSQFVPVIFEPPCIFELNSHSYTCVCRHVRSCEWKLSIATNKAFGVSVSVPKTNTDCSVIFVCVTQTNTDCAVSLRVFGGPIVSVEYKPTNLIIFTF